MKSNSFSKRWRRFIPIVLSLFFALLLVMPCTVQAGTVTVSPESASKTAGTEHTVTATTDVWTWFGGLTLVIAEGPNKGTQKEAPINDGVATFTYTSNGEPGTDTIEVYANYTGDWYEAKGIATVEWIPDTPQLVSAVVVTRPKLNVKSHGVLSITVCGSGDFDVNSVDPDSVRLEGVPAMRHTYEDVQGADGFGDLILKFKTRDIAKALGDVVDGEDRELTVTGSLANGTPLEAVFVMTIIKKGKHKRTREEKRQDKEQKRQSKEEMKEKKRAMKGK